MSGVVLRCPNCGTTQAAPGECDACHEAAVRPFCTNHEPGEWLAAPECPRCGARLGEPGAVRRPAPTVPRPPAPPKAAPPSLPRPRTSPWRRMTAPRAEDPSGLRATPGRDVLAARWRELLPRAVRGRVAPDASAYRVDAPTIPSAPAGCLGRALLLAVVFLGLFVLLSLFAGGPFLQILLSLLLSS